MTKRIVPYGYAIEDGRYTLEAEEAAVVQEIYSLYLTGESYARIADSLNHSGPAYQIHWTAGLSADHRSGTIQRRPSADRLQVCITVSEGKSRGRATVEVPLLHLWQKAVPYWRRPQGSELGQSSVQSM